MGVCTVFSDGSTRVVHRVAVLCVDEDLLRILATRLELGDVARAVDAMTRSRRDAANASEVLLGVGTVLYELIATSEWAIDGCRRIHYKQVQ